MKIQKLFGWEPSSCKIYTEAYHKFGGSVNMHPDVVTFFMKKKMHLNFFHYKKNNEVVAAYFTAGRGNVGFNVWRDYPLSYDEVVMPIDSTRRIILPERNNRLSGLQSDLVLNSMFAFRNKRKVCIVKDEFSSKTTRKRNCELKKFIAEGGEFFNLKDMSAGDIADIYVHLFKRRFADSVRCYDKNKIKDFILNVPHLVAGNCLFFRGAPGAIDLVFHAQNNDFVYFDVPNGGLEPSITQFSLGSLLMWKNILDAKELCKDLRKKMVFSIGLYEKKWDYKLMWANAIPTGKTLML
ncbi:Mig-14 family protein [Enterobacter bugandensis]